MKMVGTHPNTPPPPTRNPHLPQPPRSSTSSQPLPPRQLQPLPPRWSPSLSPWASQLEHPCPLLLSRQMPTKSDKQYEEDEIWMIQMIIGFYRLHLSSPLETLYKTEERFQVWYGKDGVITHIMGQFGLVDKTYRKRIKRVLVNVK
jgi:hypothetical protein